VAGVPRRSRDLLYWDYFQGRGGKPKRPFLIIWPVQIPSSTASTERWGRESLEERALLIGWIHNTKNTLDSIQKLTQISQDRFRDKEFGKLFKRMVSEDIHHTGLLLDGLLNYFQGTPLIKKANTVNTLIEEALKGNQAHLKEKGVRLFKKLEKDLPEIIVPDEHLRYILNSVLQYVIASTPAHGNIELLTKFAIFKKGDREEQACFEGHGGHIEILIVFSGDRESVDALETISGSIPTIQKDGALELMLRLIKEMVLKNRGIMKFEGDEKKAKTMISLAFPVERRNVAFYEPLNISPSANHLNILEI
jgi:hypothetical protein